MTPKCAFLVFAFFALVPRQPCFAAQSKVGEVLGPGVTQQAPAADAQSARYLRSTLHGLECLRDDKGFIQDKGAVTDAATVCPLTIINAKASPTELAFDLLIDLELGQTQRLTQMLRQLATMRYHRDTGLFFAWYRSGSVVDYYVPAIDNLHLALAFWTIARWLPRTPAGQEAARLFDRMKFSVFYNHKAGLFHGGLRRYKNGKWAPESWMYRYFGSESRSLYALAYALRFIDDHNFLEKCFRSSLGEVFRWNGTRLLGLWDGGAFQLLLPRLLIHEELYSPTFAGLYRSYVDFVVHEGEQRGLPLPASHSASEFADSYSGKSGNIFLVSRHNRDTDDLALRAEWEAVVTPHALLLALPIAPQRLRPVLARAEWLGLDNQTLYHPTLGWLDGLYVDTPLAGTVVRKIIALDQQMIALSLLEGMTDDGLSLPARMLFQDRAVRERLREFYARTEDWLTLLDQEH